MSEINKRIEALEAELQKLKNEVKPKFEVNKWYNSDGDSLLYITEFCSEKEFKGYGFHFGKWDEGNCIWDYENYLIPATHQEVEEALIKEAKKRGFKDGVRIKWHGILDGWDKEKSLLIGGDYYKLYANERQLSLGVTCILCDGKWAEIVKDEPIKIGGYSVEKMGESYRVGCKRFEITDFIDAKRLIEKAGVQSLRFESIEINIETINKILAL